MASTFSTILFGAIIVIILLQIVSLVRLHPPSLEPIVVPVSNDQYHHPRAAVNHEQQPQSRFQCVSHVTDVLHESPQVFISMPAKAAGTSLKDFAIECSGGDTSHHPDNFINNPNYLRPFLLKSVKVPKIVASHVFTDQPMIDLMRYGSQNSVLFYIYRDETDRLLSAIRYVVKNRLCVPGEGRWTYKKSFKVPKDVFHVQLNESFCTFDEEPFVEHLIQAGVAEVGLGARALTCDLWKEIDETAPKIVFVHYSQVDHLQAALLEKYCPHAKTKQSNLNNNNSTTKMEYRVRVQSGKGQQQEIPLDDWLQAKGPTIEFALKLSAGSCKHKTRTLQEEMKTCPMLQILPQEW
jgi:hypothetical protein